MADIVYKTKFIIEGKTVKLGCRGIERFEQIKERIWKKEDIKSDKGLYVFKTRQFARVFQDQETFARLVAVYNDPSSKAEGAGITNDKIEALVIKKTEVSEADSKSLHHRIRDDGTIPIQGYLDLMSGLTPAATPTRRYFVLKNNDPSLGAILLYYASENAFYKKESAIASIPVGNCQALKVDGVKYTFQLIRMEDGGKTGKYVLRAETDIAFKTWLQSLRQLNFQLNKSRGLQSSVWVPDAAVTKCMRCDQKFSITKRKHHCRACGAVVCGECSNEKITIHDSTEDVRVCKPCYQDHRKEMRKKKKSQTPASPLSSDGEDEDAPPPPPRDGPKDQFQELRENVRMSMKAAAATSIEGYLKKQSARGLKPWQRRYFVLDEQNKKILYYKDKKTRLMGAQGAIDLKDVKDCYHIKDETRLRFDITTGRKQYPMEAPTPAISSRWVTHINRVIRQMTTVTAPEVTTKRVGYGTASATPVKEAPKPIVLEGLLKKKHPSRLFTKWQDRYFILDEAKRSMSYFRRSPHHFPEEKELGTIDIRDIHTCKTDSADPKTFNIWMKTGRQYCILTFKEVDAMKWCNAIGQCLTALDPTWKKDVIKTPASKMGLARPTAPRPTTSSKAGWPQLTIALSPDQLIPIALRILMFVGQDDLRNCALICHFWQVITEEVLMENEDDDENSGDGEDSGDDMKTPVKKGRKPVEDDDDEYGKHVVIDNGAYSIRAGFVTEEQPKVNIAQTGGSFADTRGTDGKATVALESMNHFADAPATWKALEKAWRVAFAQLKITDTARHRVMITQPLLAPKFVQSNMEKLLFNTFKVPAINVAVAPILTCYSYGRFTGLVIDIGHTSAQVCPIVEGYLKDQATRRASHLGGEAMTRRMLEFLKYTSVSKLPLTEGLEIAQTIKEKFCYVPTDYKTALADPKNKMTYTLKNGETITVQRALPQIGEMYFDPAKVTGDRDATIVGIQDLVAESIEVSEMDTRKELLENILLSGGGTLMKGFVERLEVELKRVLPHAAESIKINADKDRQNAVWRGGAVLAKLDMFQRKWFRREEWATGGKAPT